VAGGSSTLEQWVEDALAVMDGAGVARYRPSEEPSNKAPFCHDDFEVDLFVRMNNTGGPADVWAVDGMGRAILASRTAEYRAG